jgi:hypothetical protein
MWIFKVSLKKVMKEMKLNFSRGHRRFKEHVKIKNLQLIKLSGCKNGPAV